MAVLGAVQFQPTPTPAPDVRVLQAKLSQPIASSADDVANLVGSIVDAEVLAKGLDCLLIFAFEGTSADRWEIRGDPQCPADDLLRAIAMRSKAEALAIITGTTGEFHGAPRRGIAIVAEAGGRRYERVLPLTFGPDGRPSALPVLFRWHGDGPMPQDRRWIGTPPTVEINFGVLGSSTTVGEG